MTASGMTRELSDPPQIARARAGRRTGRRVELGLGITLVAGIVLACALIPLLDHASPDALVAAPLQPPSGAHPFGTDTLGRDVLIRVFSGGRLDLTMAALGVAPPLVIGTMVGAAIGFTRSLLLDSFAMRLMDGLLAFPFVVLTLVIILIVGAGATVPPLPAGAVSVLVAVWLVDWVVYARLARAQILVLREEDFVSAARMLGFSRTRIIMRHLLPSVWPVTLTYAATDAVLFISLMAGLPFLGAGIQPPAPDWGGMLYEGRGVLGQAPWITLAPAALLVGFGLGVMLITDAVVGRHGRVRLP
jgi:peptide/nickel transport system permease protein